MSDEVKSIEKEAHRLLDEQNYAEANQLFHQAANAYRKSDKHHEAALNLASAASCWALKSGENLFFNAAKDYEKAAVESELSGNFEYTSILYKQAAVCHERDKDYSEFSECFYLSKEFYRKYLFQTLFAPSQNPPQRIPPKRKKFDDQLKKFSSWLTLSFSSYLWGHGERAHRTVLFGVSVILICSFLYTQGNLVNGEGTYQPNLFEAIYFSAITFTTVGYGDLTPVGFSRWVAMAEAFGGLFIVPVFITGLCRKYLRF